MSRKKGGCKCGYCKHERKYHRSEGTESKECTWSDCNCEQFI